MNRGNRFRHRCTLLRRRPTGNGDFLGGALLSPEERKAGVRERTGAEGSGGAQGGGHPQQEAVRVVHLTSVHRAQDTRILYRECSTLAKKGFEVVLVAPHDREIVYDGVRIHAVPQPAGRLGRMLTTVRRIYAAARHEDGDVYHYHDPELIPIAFLLKLWGKTVIADVHEDVPGDIQTKFWIPKSARRPIACLVGVLQRVAAFSADAVVAATPAVARRFPADKTTVVRNYPILNEWACVDTLEYGRRSSTVAYVGKIEGTRGIRKMVKAVHLLEGVPGIRLALAGDFSPPEFENELRSLEGWEKVEKMGFLSRSEVGRLLGRSRIGLVLLQPGPNHTEAQPNKLFEYMAAGLPVIASDFPLWGEIIERYGCGLVVDPLDPQAIASAIKTLLEHPDRAQAMGQRGRKAVATRFNWGVEAPKILGLYQRLTGWPTAGPCPGRGPSSR